MFYHKLGVIPQKRHTQFRKADGSLHFEELISTIGFDSILSNVYHINPPAKIDGIEKIVESLKLEEWSGATLRPYHFKTAANNLFSDYVYGRKVLMYNDDVSVSVCRPKDEMNYFYKNALCDEVIFVHEGNGEIQTNLGFLKYQKGDYVIIPRNTIFKIVNNSSSRFLIFEARGPVTTPRRYRNEFGQLLEHSPYCERDIRIPLELKTFDEKGDFIVKIKKGDNLFSFHYSFHPFDIVGWDGCYYPWIFNIDDFMPITGKIHQPPPVHQTFDGPGFVICSFVTRLLDYHPLSIPVPYSHSNVDSDEMLYYVDGNFFSRKGVESGSISLHPGGIPHGPHPGTVEASLGKLETVETAVMMDTFRPLKLTNWSREMSDENYYLSWK